MTLPILGAALCRNSLANHADWPREASRDLALQHFVDAEVLDGDWSGLAAEVNQMLDGHQGRRGIHGPFWGFTISSYDPEVRKIVARRMDQALDVCAAVRATHVVIHSPFTTWGYNHRGLNANQPRRLRIGSADKAREA